MSKSSEAQSHLYQLLDDINNKPEPFEFYTAEELWTDEHTSMKMLECHLNDSVDLSSRNKDFIVRSVQWIVSHFGINMGTCIADFGCGPGLYTTLLVENGADVTGIDFSKRSIAHARMVADKKDLNIEYIRKNYLEFETKKRFDLIMMIFCDYCALSPVQRKTLLATFREQLKPDGAVLLDVYSLTEFDKKEEITTYELNQYDHFWSPEKYYAFLNTFKYPNEKITLDKYTILEETRCRVVYNWLQYFNQELLKNEFEENGFIVEEFYSDVAGSPFSSESPEIAVIARKAK
jgi:cyclopropane fatty-acyl-phospholipid synthase-like methyltransferase